MGEVPTPSPARPLRRAALLVTGCVALVLGTLGVVLPLLPATPFVLLAGACFAGAWPRLHQRLAQSPLFGPMLRAGPGARYLPRRTQVAAIAFTWVSIGASIVFVARAPWLRILLGAIALGVTAFLLWMPTRPAASAAQAPPRRDPPA